MAKQPVVPSVLFFKRLIAATLALIILTLTALAVVFGVRLHRANERLDAFAAAEEQRLAAERLRATLPPEKEKPAGEKSATEILAENAIIAHALGSVDGVAGLNCLEGFLSGYEEGVRVFEADFRLTADGRVILRHDWRAGWQEGISEQSIPTLEEFLAAPILEKYTPLSFQDLLLLMEQYPDVCIVTDTKYLDAEVITKQFTAMAADARELGLTYLFDRMAVQVYSAFHYGVVDNIHHFPHYIYTLYQDNFMGDADDFRRRANYAQEKGIEGITMWDYLWHEAWDEVADYRGVKVYVHTVNDAAAARQLLEDGISAVYTDSLRPADLEG